MSTNPWTERGPLDDLFTELEGLLAEYGERADERLRAFAQRNLRGQPWVRELGPWVRETADGRCWDRDFVNDRGASIWGTRVSRNHQGWWALNTHLNGAQGPYATRNEAMIEADEEARLFGWLFDEALPPEAAPVDEGQREEEPEAINVAEALEGILGTPTPPPQWTLPAGRAPRRTFTSGQRHRWNLIRGEGRGALLRCERCGLYQFNDGVRFYLPAATPEEAWRDGQRREGRKRPGTCRPTEGA